LDLSLISAMIDEVATTEVRIPGHDDRRSRGMAIEIRDDGDKDSEAADNVGGAWNGHRPPRDGWLEEARWADRRRPGFLWFP